MFEVRLPNWAQADVQVVAGTDSESSRQANGHEGSRKRSPVFQAENTDDVHYELLPGPRKKPRTIDQIDIFETGQSASSSTYRVNRYDVSDQTVHFLLPSRRRKNETALAEQYKQMFAQHFQRDFPIDYSNLDRVLVCFYSLYNRDYSGFEEENIYQVTVKILCINHQALYETTKLSGDNPLHLALRYFARNERLLMHLVHCDTENKLLSMANYYGHTPYDIACTTRVPSSVIQAMARRLPTAALHTSKQLSMSLLPILHNKQYHLPYYQPLPDVWQLKGSFLERVETTSKRTCQKALEQGPEFLPDTIITQLKNHFANSSSFPANSININEWSLIQALRLAKNGEHTFSQRLAMLLHAAKVDDLNFVDNEDNNVLHHALGIHNTSCTDENFSHQWTTWLVILVNQNSHLCYIVNKNGELPLHTTFLNNKNRDECECNSIGTERSDGMDWQVVSSVVSANPNALQEKASGQYPFMLAASSKNVSLDTLYSLIRLEPHLVRMQH